LGPGEDKRQARHAEALPERLAFEDRHVAVESGRPAARIHPHRGADTKTDEGRLVPLNERLTRALKDVMHSAICPASGHVFHRQGKSIKDLRKAFAAACRKAAIADFRFHALRHTAVTSMRARTSTVSRSRRSADPRRSRCSGGVVPLVGTI
jgi:integrase